MSCTRRASVGVYDAPASSAAPLACGIVGGGSSEDFARFRREDVAKWAEVVKFAGVKLE